MLLCTKLSLICILIILNFRGAILEKHLHVVEYLVWSTMQKSAGVYFPHLHCVFFSNSNILCTFSLTGQTNFVTPIEHQEEGEEEVAVN